MLTSLLLLFKFIVDIFKRIINDNYYRSLALVILLVLTAGTLFYWLVQGTTFVQAFGYAATTMAMNSPYGLGWGTTNATGIIFHVIYTFLSVGIFILFVLETGKTMLKTYEDMNKSIAAKSKKK
jgi:hypothetical protein